MLIEIKEAQYDKVNKEYKKSSEMLTSMKLDKVTQDISLLCLENKLTQNEKIIAQKDSEITKHEETIVMLKNELSQLRNIGKEKENINQTNNSKLNEKIIIEPVKEKIDA